jgi:cytochrome c biogenesis protein CcmG, thiol:disulfide interchange protein DsbE
VTEPADPSPSAARGLALALVACTAVLSACTAEARTTAETAAPFAGCAALTAPPPSAPVTSAPATSAPATSAPATSAPATSAPATSAPATSVGTALPDLELPCFAGGDRVRLTGLRGPAVINLWASWCEPCRAELPVLQQLADRAAGRLTVLGVDTGDDRDAAASFGTDHKIGMPTLYDRDQKLLGALGRATLPVTIFLGADGTRHVEPLPLDDSRLDELVRTWTGVTVTR